MKMRLVSRLGQLTGGPFPAVGGFYAHPNAQAAFIEGGLPLAVGLWLSARDRRGRLLAGLSFILLGYSLFLTASRGAWLALAACAGLTFAVWVVRRLSANRRQLGLLALVALAVAVVAGAGLALIGPERVPGLASALDRGADRADLYNNSLYLIRDYPLLGIGLGDTFGPVHSEYMLLVPYTFLNYAHNLPLSIWLNQGLLGLVSFGWILIAFYWPVIGHVRRGADAPLYWGAVVGVTAMLLHGLTDAPQYSDSRWVMPIFYALLGLSVATAPAAPSTVSRGRPASRRLALVVGAIVILAVAVGILMADIFYTNLGAVYQTRGDLSPALDDAARRRTVDQAASYYERALEINGQQPMAHWRLGLIALNRDKFPTAIPHLEMARSALPGHRGIQKALGYAYLWDGQIEKAAGELRPLEEVPQELGTWSWWRGEQGQDELAAYARQLGSRLESE
jgi:O-antigen ligase